MAYTYILYSHEIDRYYIGSTSSALEDRLRRHLSDHKGYTGRTKDWVCVWSMYYDAITDARAMEAKIKRRKSRAYIQELIHSLGT